MTAGYFVAAGIAGLTAGIHLTRGSTGVVRPLLEIEGLNAGSRWMNFYTWHMASITVVAMAAGFLWAALRSDGRPVGVLLTVLAAAFSGLCVYVCLRAGFPLIKVPPVYLFAGIAAAGSWGVYAGRPSAVS